MRLVFAGTPAVALPSLRALIDSPRHDVVAVVTRPDRPSGRGRTVKPPPVHALADEAGIPVLSPERPRDPEFLAQLADIAPDCCPVVAYGALLPREALAIPRHGWVNLHFSLLPAYRGAAPVQRAVLAGDDMTGASVFQIEPAMDSGPVFGVLTERIEATDTSGDLLDRLAEAGSRLLVAVMDGLEDGTVQALAQPAEGVSLAPKLTVDEVRVDWTAPATAVDRLVRAATPAPGAWTMFRDRRLKLGPVQTAPPGSGDRAGSTTASTASALSGSSTPSGSSGSSTPSGSAGGHPGRSTSDSLPALRPGEIAVLAGGAVAVGTGSTPVLLGEVRPEGRGAMAAADWARGVRPTEGETLSGTLAGSPAGGGAA